MYKALVVDDEKMIRMGIKGGIPWKEIGIGEVYTAASAREALLLIEEHRPEILLTDISMTEMTGLSLIEQIRKENEEMRILVLTGYDRFDYARQCLQMRVQNFLLKPIDEEELTATIKEQVDILESLRVSREENSRQRRTEGARQQMELERYMRDRVHQRKNTGREACLPEELVQDRNQEMQIAILIPDLYLDQSKPEENLRGLTIKNICIGLIDSRRSGVTFMDEDGKLVLMFYTGREEVDVTSEIQELSQILEDEYEMKPRIVLGGKVMGLDSIHISYNDAVYLLEHEREGIQGIVRSNKEQSRENLFQDAYREMKQSMASGIANGDYVMHVYESFQKATVSYNLSRIQVQKCCFEIAASVYYSYITETGEGIDNKLEALMKSLMGVDREESLEVTGMFLKQLLFKEEGDRHEIIAKAKRYIDEHLECDLSVASLAEAFYVSPNYFSRLFKKVMGEGCNEYIVRKRIDKSKSLLETTTIKAGKIALMVGYNDTNYFSMAFKKHTGMSPTKYRQMMQEKERS